MKRTLLWVLPVVLVSWMMVPAMGQENPRPREGEDRPRMAPRSEGGPADRGANMGQLDMVRGYLDIVDRYTRLARDPVAAGVAAVVSANEVLKAKGTDAAIAYFTKLLPDVKNDAVKAAIRLQLVELYKSAGQQDKALDQLQEMIVSAPPAPQPPMMRDGGMRGEGGMDRPAPGR